MSSLLEVKVPDIGDFKEIPIIEILVKPGDSVKAEDPLIALESDKATMEVPAPQSGVVKEIKVKVGDKVSQGTLVLMLDAAESAAPAAPAAAKAPAQPAAAPATASAPPAPAAPPPASAAPQPVAAPASP
ncbi:MAG: biotin/lipoyl-containing protein, partial [Betaproteobacteria bacterium]